MINIEDKILANVRVVDTDNKFDVVMCFLLFAFLMLIGVVVMVATFVKETGKPWNDYDSFDEWMVECNT